MIPAFGSWPSWAHALAAVVLCLIGLAAGLGIAALLNSPRFRHALHLQHEPDCGRCVEARALREQLIDLDEARKRRGA